MPTGFDGVEELSVDEILSLVDDDGKQETPPADVTNSDSVSTETNDSLDTTKAFAKRLKTATDKARKEERDNIAKSLGYQSYEDLQKKREANIYEENGLDQDEVGPIVDKIVKERLNNDPRLLELEEFRKQKVAEFGKKELAELTKLTDGEITKLEQVPKEVIDLWKTKGSLKKAYLEVCGEELIMKAKSAVGKGTTSHLASPSGVASYPTDSRPLTNEEKQMWKFFNPTMTDEELNKKTVKK